MAGFQLPHSAPAQKVVTAKAVNPAGNTPKEADSIWNRDIRLGPLFRLKDRLHLYQLLGVLIDSGLAMREAFEVLADQFQKAALKAEIQAIKAELEQGTSLSDALAKRPQHFGSFEYHSIRMGEETGQLSTVLQSLSGWYEKRLHLRRKFFQAMSYPLAVIVIATGVLAFMLTMVVPMFKDVFQRFDAELPPITQFMLDLSDGVQNYGGWGFLGLGLVILALWRVRKTQRGHRLGGELMLRIPLIGPIWKKLQLARWAYSFALLLQAKLPLDRCLTLLADIQTFYPLQQALGRIRTAVINGQSLFQAMQQERIFPAYLAQMVRVGEKTAQLDPLMTRLAKRLDEESQAGVGQLTQLLEPLLIVLLGGMVGLILISMYLPMFELSRAFG